MNLLALTIVFPLAGSLALSFFPRMADRAAATIGAGSVGLSALVSAWLIYTFVTGDGSWQMSDSGPAPGWLSPGFPSSAWDEPVPCTDLGPWGDWSSLPLDHGARWVWYHPTGDCRAPVSWGEAWFRLEFNLP